MNTPDRIYLMDSGDGIVWCEDPAPGEGVDAGDAEAYVKASALSANLYRPGIDGCSDGCCIFKDNRKGMHTNGGCRCERELRRHPEGFKAIQTIHYLREQLRRLSD